VDWSLIFENTLKGFIGINAVYFAIAALGLNVQFGYTGLLNFGQAGFMACGAYGLGMTAQYFEISMWWGIPLGILFSVGLGLLMGVPTLRLRADYLAIVTIAAAEIIRLVVRSVRFKHYFGGSDGINNFSQTIPRSGIITRDRPVGEVRPSTTAVHRSGIVDDPRWMAPGRIVRNARLQTHEESLGSSSESHS